MTVTMAGAVKKRTAPQVSTYQICGDFLQLSNGALIIAILMVNP